MAEPNSCSNKPTLVRIKRKVCDESVDHLWLERNAPKRQELDVSKFSLNDKPAEDHGRVLFRRLQTVPISQAKDISFSQSLLSELAHMSSCDSQNARQITYKKVRTAKLTAKEQHEKNSQKARYKQVWKNRRMQRDEDTMHECFRLYDVERTDEEEEEMQRDSELLSKYMSMLQEYCPQVYGDKGEASSEADEYVYDMYVQDEEVGSEEEDDELVTLKVCDWDALEYGAGEEVDSAYDSEDSNREDHPDNDYPDEEKDEDESSEDVEDISSVEIYDGDDDDDKAAWKMRR